MLQLSDTGVFNKPSAVIVGYKHWLMPGIILQYGSIDCVSPTGVVIALGVLAASDCSGP